MTQQIIRRIGSAIFLVIVAFCMMSSSPAGSIAKRHVAVRGRKSSHSASHKSARYAKLSRHRKHHHVQQHLLTATEKQEIITKMHAMASSQVVSEDSIIAAQAASPEIQSELAQSAKEELAEDTDVDVSIANFFKARPDAIGSKDATNVNDGLVVQEDFALVDESHPEHSAQRSDIMAEIIDWLGTRYEFGGEDRGGVDCSAFTRAIFAKAFGVTLPRTAFEQHQLGASVEKSDLHFGDLVFFHTARYSPVSHVGIYLGEGLFANSCCSRGVSVASLDSPYWDSHYIGAKRLFTNNGMAQTVVDQLHQMASNVTPETADPVGE